MDSEHCIYYLGQPGPGVRLQSKYWCEGVFRWSIWKQREDLSPPSCFPPDAHQHFRIPLHPTSRRGGPEGHRDNGETNKRANGEKRCFSLKTINL